MSCGNKVTYSEKPECTVRSPTICRIRHGKTTKNLGPSEWIAKPEEDHAWTAPGTIALQVLVSGDSRRHPDFDFLGQGIRRDPHRQVHPSCLALAVSRSLAAPASSTSYRYSQDGAYCRIWRIQHSDIPRMAKWTPRLAA